MLQLVLQAGLSPGHARGGELSGFVLVALTAATIREMCINANSGFPRPRALGEDQVHRLGSLFDSLMSLE